MSTSTFFAMAKHEVEVNTWTEVLTKSEMEKLWLNFKLSVNGLWDLKFIYHKSKEMMAEQNQKKMSLSEEIDSLQAEINDLSEIVSSDDQELRLKKRELYSKEKLFEKMWDERRDQGYQIKNFGTIWSSDFDKHMEELVKIVFKSKNKTMHSVLFRLGIEFNGNQIDPKYIPEGLQASIVETEGKEQPKRDEQKEVSLKDWKLYDNKEEVEYFSQMEEAEEY